jgi:fructosamine-3-kinase
MSNIKKVNFNKLIEYDKPIIDDPTDIKDDDETDINTESLSTELNDDDIYLTNLMNKFLENYPHLNNYKNKKIIYELCNILVVQMPEHKSNQSFYLNLLDSTIKDITSPTIDNFLK